jgi:hypothetical protein
MALVKISPLQEARVTWDRAADRPAAVRFGGRHLRVIDLDTVRDERSAYPSESGPRVTFVLRTEDGGRASLVYDDRAGRWYLEALEPAA